MVFGHIFIKLLLTTSKREFSNSSSKFIGTGRVIRLILLEAIIKYSVSRIILFSSEEVKWKRKKRKTLF